MQHNQRGHLDDKPGADHFDEAVAINTRDLAISNGDDAVKALEGWVTIVATTDVLAKILSPPLRRSGTCVENWISSWFRSWVKSVRIVKFDFS